MKTKVAVPTKNSNVDDHFGHCEYYTIFSIENNEVKDSEELKAPNGCGCKSNIASILEEMCVDTLLAGNMGQGAVNKINATGIKVIRGCSGSIDSVIKEYLDGKLNDSGLTCDNHFGNRYGHTCSH